jgi:DNA-binding response OmpR family regulator
MNAIAGKRVLIVEDDQELRELLRTTLEGEGFTAEIATDGAEGLSRLRRGVPDLVLLDLVLPRVNGLEVLMALRSDPAARRVPVIVMTGTQTQASELRGLGVVALLYKPFATDALLARIAAVLRLPQSPAHP